VRPLLLTRKVSWAWGALTTGSNVQSGPTLQMRRTKKRRLGSGVMGVWRITEWQGEGARGIIRNWDDPPSPSYDLEHN
jgi:hypothetical protein